MYSSNNYLFIHFICARHFSRHWVYNVRYTKSVPLGCVQFSGRNPVNYSGRRQSGREEGRERGREKRKEQERGKGGFKC